jgi:hypothetical protein
MTNIRKQTFIEKLQHFARVEGRGIRDEYGHDDYWPMRGETVLARMIATYLARPEIEDRWPEDNWFLSLPNHLVTAFEAFRTEPAFEIGRKAYALVTGDHAIPNLVDVYAGGLHRALVAHGIARLMSVLSGEAWLRSALEDRFGAQMQAIETAWRRFVRVAYTKLIVRINAERHRGNTGIFGATTLMTWACAGRVMCTFEGPGGSDDVRRGRLRSDRRALWPELTGRAMAIVRRHDQRGHRPLGHRQAAAQRHRGDRMTSLAMISILRRRCDMSCSASTDRTPIR